MFRKNFTISIYKICHIVVFKHYGTLIVIIKKESSNLKPCSKGGREDSLRFMDSIVILQVWNKGQAVPGYDNSKYRKDQCGA